MTRFQTILARLCAASGETMLHVDSPAGRAMATMLSASGLETLTDALGEENLAILTEDQEVQMLLPGNPAQAEAAGHIQLMRVIKALVDVEGSSAMLITGSGKVSTWQQGGQPGADRLDDIHLTQAFTRRVANSMPAAAE